MQDSVMSKLPPEHLTDELLDGSNLTPGQQIFAEALTELPLLQQHVGAGLVGLLTPEHDRSGAHIPFSEVRGAVIQMCQTETGVHPVGLFSRARHMHLVGGANRDRMTRCRLDQPPLRPYAVAATQQGPGQAFMPLTGPLFLRMNGPYVELRTEVVSVRMEQITATVARFERAAVESGAVKLLHAERVKWTTLHPNQNHSLAGQVRRGAPIATVAAGPYWTATLGEDCPDHQLLNAVRDDYVYYTNNRLTHVFGALLVHLVRALQSDGPTFMFDPGVPYPRVRMAYAVDPAVAAFHPEAVLTPQARDLLDVFLTEGIKNDAGVVGRPCLLAPSGVLERISRSADGSRVLVFAVANGESESILCPPQFVLANSVVIGAAFQEGDNLGEFNFTEAEVTLNRCTYVQSVRLPLPLQQLCMGQMLQHLSVYPGELGWPEDADSCLFDPQLIYWPRRGAQGFVDTRNLSPESWDEVLMGYVSPLLLETEHAAASWGNLRIDLPYAATRRPVVKKRKSRAAVSA